MCIILLRRGENHRKRFAFRSAGRCGTPWEDRSCGPSSPAFAAKLVSQIGLARAETGDCLSATEAASIHAGNEAQYVRKQLFELEDPLKTRKLLILKAQKTQQTQETLVSLRSYCDRMWRSRLRLLPVRPGRREHAVIGAQARRTKVALLALRGDKASAIGSATCTI